MTDSYGNLALQRKPAVQERRPVFRPVRQRAEIKTRRIPVTATPAPDQIALLKARAIHRGLARQRLKLLCGIVALVFLVTGVFTLVVYRQAMILETNFKNIRTEKQINLVNQEISQISESLAQKTNLDDIRRQAVEKFGLQDPGQLQIVQVDIPESDRVVFVSSAITSTEDEAYLANVFTTIEGFFKTLNRQGQGH